jgi:hypothetical protein
VPGRSSDMGAAIPAAATAAGGGSGICGSAGGSAAMGSGCVGSRPSKDASTNSNVGLRNGLRAKGGEDAGGACRIWAV